MEKLYFLIIFAFIGLSTQAQDEAFITTWEITSNNLSITIPTDDSYDYDYTVDFGDGTVETNVTETITHTYNSPDVYTVNINGDFPKIEFDTYDLLSVEQWGDLEFATMNNAFSGCSNLEINATDAPDLSQVEDMANMFSSCTSLNSNINHWDVSNITDMSFMFHGAEDFNQPLNNWDVSNVENMHKMFQAAESFNQSLNNWNIGSVLDMSDMFYHAYMFNGNISQWDTSNVENLGAMFVGADNFDQNLNDWNVFNVTNMSYMFFGADSFNQPLNNWDVSSVTNMSGLFLSASSFNQDLSSWDISNVTNFDSMFSGATSYDQSFITWNFNTTNFSNFVVNTNLSISNYDSLLQSLAVSGLQNGNLSANLEYCDIASRDYLTEVQGWSISNDILSDDCNSIYGVLSFDEENDGCDENDILINNINVQLQNQLNTFNSLSFDGLYDLGVSGDNFSVSIVNLPSYFTASPESVDISFTESNQEIEQNFCITSNQTIEDLNVVLVPVGEARPGFEADYQLVVENLGTQSVDNVTLTLDFDDNMQTFVSANPNPDVTGTNQLTFQIPSLQVFETMTFDLTMQTFQPPTVVGDDILNFTANITPDANDYTPYDNQYDLRQTVVNSYDPNDKQVLEGDQVLIENSDQYLHYLIRFQNTGTASAINVRIEDILHDKLDWSTIRPVSSSHNYRIEITDSNQVEFIFDEIFLPHEDADEAGSNGFVAYKIKPKADVEIGDVVSGDAAIYFDYNPPIITNTVSTTFVEELSIADYAINQIQVYPNPTSRQLNINSTDNLQVENMTLFDIHGKTIKQIEGSQRQIDMQNLEAGIYFLKIQTEHGESTKKIIKR